MCMNSIPKLLSKTKLMRGYRCAKSIYLTIHEPELESPITPDLQALFDQGNSVGRKAREYFPGGTLIANKPWDFYGAITKTRELMAAGVQTIYEAAFEYLGCYARIDILQYSQTSQKWNIYEVKSSTKVKPEHYDDTGLQAWILANNGLPIEKIHLMHLNPECRHPNLDNLFRQVDVTQEIREQYLSIRPKLHEIFTILQQSEIPEADLGAHCLSPTECGFKAHCWKQNAIPDFSILNLPNMHTRKWDLFQQGIIDIHDTRLDELNELQQRIVACHQSGDRYINQSAIQSALNDWKFPLVFLDFETINPAIPRYDNCKPYEQVPFQFSVHQMKSLHGEIAHYEFLYETLDDPRPALISALLNACGNEGSIVAYFSQFEIARIHELAEFSPSHSKALEQLIARMVDPLTIIRECVYDVGFAGSFSLKRVAPTLLGSEQSYDGMLVGNGQDAQRAYEEFTSQSISFERKKELRNAMLEYCKKDTYVMVELVKWLYKQIKT